MELTIDAFSQVTLEGKDGVQTSKHISTEIHLDVSDELDRSKYISKEGLPTELGSKAITQCFTQGLICNIHAAHETGQWDSAAHLRYIISELERGFVTVATVEATEIHRD